MKRPSFQFYPADWRKDLALRKCSLAARGMWVELMCIAHECEPYGTLRHNGEALQADDIAGLVGMCSPREAKSLIDELVRKGVAKIDDDGVIYSKRMVHDERVRNARAEGGKAGAEHGAKGAEHGAKGGRPPGSKGDGKGGYETPLQADSKPPPSSSSSSSASAEEQDPPASRVPPAASPRATKKAPKGLALSPELRAWAAEHAPHVADVDAEFAAMCDHTFVGSRSDWDGTFRNWLRKAEKDAVAKLQAAAGRRAAATAEPEWRRLERERNEAALGPYAAKRKPPTNTIDMEPQHGTASLLD